MEMPKRLSSNSIKLIAIIAMTVDHLTWVIFPGYRTEWQIIALHMLGRITAPIMWFFIAEGYHYTHNLKKYIIRMFAFAAISHFAYTFAFGISPMPFQASVFNQTSIIWPLAWGLVVLKMNDNREMALWKKVIAVLAVCAITFSSDWSCIAVMAILYIGENRGAFKKQMLSIIFFTAIYAAVYVIFINRIYGFVQMCVILSVPILAMYNGERGKMKGMKWFFYLYYPAHLFLCGFIRLALHGNVAAMIGG